jgi:hypothetical protein
LYATWFVPLVINYSKLGGFVSITHIIAVTLPASAILVSWGLTTPLAVLGAIRYGSKVTTERHVRLLLLFVGSAGTLLMVSAVIPGTLGDAFDTLGRAHRYWPIFYLSVALVAALGFTDLLSFFRARSRALAVGALVAMTAIAWTSPVVASIALPSKIGRYPEIEAAMREDPSSLLYELRRLGPGCKVAAPQGIAREVFSYTGFRLVLWTGAWYGDNRARIRWADIYDRIGSEQQRIEDNKALVSGRSDDVTAILDRYGVDLVVLPAPLTGGRGLAEAEHLSVTYGDADYSIVKIRDCTPD